MVALVCCSSQEYKPICICFLLDLTKFYFILISSTKILLFRDNIFIKFSLKYHFRCYLPSTNVYLNIFKFFKEKGIVLVNIFFFHFFFVGFHRGVRLSPQADDWVFLKFSLQNKNRLMAETRKNFYANASAS